MPGLARFSEETTPFPDDLIPYRNPKLLMPLCKCLWKMSFRVKPPSLTQNGNVDATQFGNSSSRAPSRVRQFHEREDEMKEQTVRLGPREQQIVELLLQGCDNAEIASQLKMARRTVKAHFNRLFLRFGITGGIKRVKLATLLYRRQACQVDATGTVSQVNVNTGSSSSLPRA
jgi:DNA-binding CsgD family transcriptional regulator